MSAIVNGPKNGSRKPNDERTTSSTCSGVGEAVLDDPRRLPEHRELDPVGDESRPVADDDRRLAEPRRAPRRPAATTCSSVDGVRDHLDARDEQRRHEPVHAEEAARAARSPAASSAIGIDDVFVAITAPSPAAASIAA